MSLFGLTGKSFLFQLFNPLYKIQVKIMESDSYEENIMTSAHMELFSVLVANGRVSIRANNKKIKLWERLKSARLCTIFETDRAGTVVIHLTPQGEALARQFVFSLQNELYPSSQPYPYPIN